MLQLNCCNELTIFYNQRIENKKMATNTLTNTGALAAIDELRIDSKIGKSKHFNASDRKMFWHRFFGVPVIIANLFVGIVLVSLQGSNASPPANYNAEANVIIQKERRQVDISNKETDIKPEKEGNIIPAASTPEFLQSGLSKWLGLLSILLAFGAASLSGIQTFFNFHKASEGHRAIGNRYVYISRQCKGLQQKHLDVPYSAADLWAEYEKLCSDYHQINTEAEAFPTSGKDLKKAKNAAEISPYKVPRNSD